MTTAPPPAFIPALGDTRGSPFDDVVMGARSASSAALSADGSLVFVATVSLDDGRGFASIRCAPGSHDASRCRGILIRVRGDGKTAELNLDTGPDFDDIRFQAAFTPAAGARQEVALRGSAFEPRHRGRPRSDAAPLDPASIVTVGFLVSDRQGPPRAGNRRPARHPLSHRGCRRPAPPRCPQQPQ